MGLVIVFGLPPDHILPETYTRIEDEVMTNGAELDGRLRGKTDAKSLRKLRLLSEMVKRATGRTSGV